MGLGPESTGDTTAHPRERRVTRDCAIRLEHTPPDGHVLVELPYEGVRHQPQQSVNAQSNDPVTQGAWRRTIARQPTMGKVINIYLNDSIIEGVAKTRKC